MESIRASRIILIVFAALAVAGGVFATQLVSQGSPPDLGDPVLVRPTQKPSPEESTGQQPASGQPTPTRADPTKSTTNRPENPQTTKTRSDKTESDKNQAAPVNPQPPVAGDDDDDDDRDDGDDNDDDDDDDDAGDDDDDDE